MPGDKPVFYNYQLVSFQPRFPVSLFRQAFNSKPIPGLLCITEVQSLIIFIIIIMLASTWSRCFTEGQAQQNGLALYS